MKKMEPFKRRKPHVPCTPERQQKFLEFFRGHVPGHEELGGRKWLCAEAVGVSYSAIRNHRQKDPVFDEAFEEARECWVDENLLGNAVKRAVEGVQQHALGGKDRDEAIPLNVAYSDGIMSMLLKGHRHQYRESHTGGDGASEGGGVMIIPANPATTEDWEQSYSEMAKGKTGRDGER